MNASAEPLIDLPAIMRDPDCIPHLSTAKLTALNTELEQRILLGTTELRVWGMLARVHNELAKRKRTTQTH